jgi:uncharacterized membrane protein YoaK (UPF0700 family)
LFDQIDMTKPSNQQATAQGLLAVCGALICGYVDSYALATFGIYASFMSGNTTSAGLLAGQVRLPAAGHSLLPIPFFVFGIITGTLIPGDQRRRLKTISSLVAAMLVLVLITVWMAWPGVLSVILLSAAMGILSTSVTIVSGQAVSMGWVTGDLNNIARHIANGIRKAPLQQPQGPGDTHWRRAALLATVWAAFLIGAVLGGAVASRLAAWTLLFPVILLLAPGLIPIAAHSET